MGKAFVCPVTGASVKGAGVAAVSVDISPTAYVDIKVFEKIADRQYAQSEISDEGVAKLRASIEKAFPFKKDAAAGK